VVLMVKVAKVAMEGLVVGMDLVELGQVCHSPLGRMAAS